MTRILVAVLAFYIVLGLTVWALARPASAQSTHDAPTTGAEIGRIVIVNLEQTQMYVRADHEFQHNGQTVTVTVHYTSTPNWGVEDTRDRITIAVPDGYIAIPPEVTLPENDTVEVAIYEAIVG